MHLALEGDFADATDPGDSRVYEGGRVGAKLEGRSGGLWRCPPVLAGVLRRVTTGLGARRRSPAREGAGPGAF